MGEARDVAVIELVVVVVYHLSAGSFVEKVG